MLFQKDKNITVPMYPNHYLFTFQNDFFPQNLRYMEEIVESTLSLLSVKHDQSHLVSQKILDPIYFLALVDTKAVWFKKWMVRKNWFFSLILVTSRLYVPDVC